MQKLDAAHMQRTGGCAAGRVAMETEGWQQKKIRSESEVLGSSQTSPQLPQKWGQVEICPCLLLKQAGTGQDETGTGRRVAQEPPGDVTFTGAAPQAATIPGRKDFITAHQECCLCTALLSHNEE